MAKGNILAVVDTARVGWDAARGGWVCAVRHSRATDAAWQEIETARGPVKVWRSLDSLQAELSRGGFVGSMVVAVTGPDLFSKGK